MNVKNKINSKWMPLAWVALVVSEYLRNLYYSVGVDMPQYAATNGVTIAVGWFVNLLSYSLIPTVLVVLLTSIAYSACARRRLTDISRNDFFFVVLITTSAANVLGGVVQCFAFLDQGVFVYTESYLDLLLLAISYSLAFFLVVKPKFLGKYSAEYLSVWGGVFLVWEAISTLLPCALMTAIAAGQNIPQVAQIFEEYTTAQEDLVSSLVAIGLYVVVLILLVIACTLIRKKAKDLPDDYNGVRQSENDVSKQNDDVNPFEDSDDWQDVDSASEAQTDSAFANGNNETDKKDKDDINDIFGL